MRGWAWIPPVAAALALLAAARWGTRSMSLSELSQGPVAEIWLGARLPRVVAAGLVGAALAAAGALMQALTRNPLAGPSIAGLNTGAALAALAVSVWIPGVSAAAQGGAALAGAAAAAGLVAALGGLSLEGAGLVLTGATVNLTLGAALVGVVVQHQLHMDLLFWTTGGLLGVTWADVAALAPLVAVGLLGAAALTRGLEVLSLGDSAATGLGVRGRSLRVMGLACVVLLAGSAVAVAGPLGFVGVLAPHLARGLVGGELRRALPAAIWLGAALVMIADLGVRAVAEWIDLPVGAVVASVGGAAFVALVMRGPQVGVAR